MYNQINPTEIFRERQLALRREADNRRLARRRLRAAQRGGTEEKGMGHLRRAALLFVAAIAMAVLSSTVALAATNTFSNGTPIQITETEAQIDPASPYPSEINIRLLGGTIQDINLKLNDFSHTFPSDVHVLLVGPGGQQALVMSAVGGDIPVSDVNLTLDDEAETFLNQPLSSGTYKPTSNANGEFNSFPAPAPVPNFNTALSVFDGTSPNGTWKLFVVDDQNGDSGQFAGGWSLEITTGSSAPPTDTTAPKVISTVPSPRATGVAPRANVSATFSEEMDASSINSTTFKLFEKGTSTPVSGATVSYEAATDTATLDPTNRLKRGATYKAVVSTEAEDLAGNQLDQKSTRDGLQPKKWLFTVRN